MKTAESVLEGKDKDGEGSSRSVLCYETCQKILKQAAFPDKSLSKGLYYTC